MHKNFKIYFIAKIKVNIVNGKKSNISSEKKSLSLITQFNNLSLKGMTRPQNPFNYIHDPDLLSPSIHFCCCWRSLWYWCL